MTAPLLTDPCLDQPIRTPLSGGRRMRIVQLVATGSNGGAQEHVWNLLERLDRSRYDLSVISLSDGAAVRRFRALGVPVTVVNEADDSAALDQLVRLLEERPPAVLHLHMYRAEVLGTRAALALGELGLPRPYIVSTVHSSRIRSDEDRELLRALTPSIDRLVAVSRAIVAKLRSEGRDTVPVELIYNGVDLSRYDHQEACCTLPEEYGFAAGTPLVGVVARLESEKGHPTLLEAWPQVLERVPEARLLIVGEGSRREALEEQARGLGLLGDECDGERCVGTRHARPGAKVVFTGRRDDVPAVTAALDVAVLPSYREAQGMVILEAMALSRPVVATSVGGIPEMIEDGVTGLLVPPRDPRALAAAIRRLLDDHPLADTLARAGHDLVHERFCLERMIAEVGDIYEAGALSVSRRSAGARTAA
ncbi:MAG: glycosyltransferase [Chloroflexota bacterium]|nr:glycosyltransferase [Chloroflexota bacterium]